MLRALSRFTSALVATLRAVTYTTPTPSTVSAGQQFPASAYNIISADIQDHESRISTNEANIATNTTNILKGVQSYTTTQRDALTGVTTGTQIYNSTKGIMEVWNGSAWVILSRASKVPHVLVTRTTNQTHGSTSQLITWQASSNDTDGMWSSSSNPEQVTINTPGLYVVSAGASCGATAGTYTAASYASIGGTGGFASYSPALILASGATAWFSVHVVNLAAAGDFCRLTFTPGGATAGNINSATLWMRVTYIGNVA